MRRTLRLATILSAVVAFFPTQVRAASITIGDIQTWTYDGTSAGCTTCSAGVSFELLSSNSLKISFENTSTDLLAGVNVLTGIGLDTSGLTDLAILQQDIEGGKVWKLTGGIGGGSWEISLASKSGINHGLDNDSDLSDSGYVILGWTSSGSGLTELALLSSVVKFQGVAVSGGAILAEGTADNLSTLSPGSDPPTDAPVPVPEPSTLLLSAVGVGAVFRRVSKARAVS